MPTIALVDDDRNILTSVGMTLEAEGYADRKSTRLNSSHIQKSRMPSSA